MQVILDPGHNIPNVDTGVTGEDSRVLTQAQRIRKLFEDDGHEVVWALPDLTSGEWLIKSTNSSLRARCIIANKHPEADLYISFHLNAFNGKARGTETFYFSSAGLEYARPVNDALVSLGFKNRGCKKKGFYVLRNTTMPAILIESCFVDNSADRALFDELMQQTDEYPQGKLVHTLYNAITETSK
jgi:N-acetylmuramoyl-L-alanine amidase